MTTKLTEKLWCACNPSKKTYASKSSFQNHFTSDRHRLWELHKQNRALREQNGHLENENNCLKRKIADIQSLLVTSTPTHKHNPNPFAKSRIDKLD